MEAKKDLTLPDLLKAAEAAGGKGKLKFNGTIWGGSVSINSKSLPMLLALAGIDAEKQGQVALMLLKLTRAVQEQGGTTVVESGPETTTVKIEGLPNQGLINLFQARQSLFGSKDEEKAVIDLNYDGPPLHPAA